MFLLHFDIPFFYYKRYHKMGTHRISNFNCGMWKMVVKSLSCYLFCIVKAVKLKLIVDRFVEHVFQPRWKIFNCDCYMSDCNEHGKPCKDVSSNSRKFHLTIISNLFNSVKKIRLRYGIVRETSTPLIRWITSMGNKIRRLNFQIDG